MHDLTPAFMLSVIAALIALGAAWGEQRQRVKALEAEREKDRTALQDTLKELRTEQKEMQKDFRAMAIEFAKATARTEGERSADRTGGHRPHDPFARTLPGSSR